jgi:hypothetical protein
MKILIKDIKGLLKKAVVYVVSYIHGRKDGKADEKAEFLEKSMDMVSRARAVRRKAVSDAGFYKRMLERYSKR